MDYTVPDAPLEPHDPRAVDRILGVYLRSMPPEPLEQPQGHSWYAETARAIVDLTPGVLLWRSCSVASALSPGVRWETVLEHLPRVLTECDVGRSEGGNLYQTPAGPFYLASREKALAVYHDGPNGFDPKKAPKTARFTLNLLGHEEVVTVDRWAFKVAGIKGGSYRRYCVAEASYIEAGRLLGEEPAGVQAVTWVAVRDRGVALW